MDLNEKNIFIKNQDFPSLDDAKDVKVINNYNYFFNDNLMFESDSELNNPNFQINTELFSFNNKISNEITDQKGINGFKDLYYKNFQDDKYLNNKKYFESVQLKIKEKIFSKKPFKEKKILGRRRKCEKILGVHNKYSDDNIIRKCKSIILNSAINFINKKINFLYLNEAKKYPEKKLFKLKQNQSLKSKTSYNKSFLNATLKMIFSEDVSSKYSKYSPSHNRDLIKSLLNENDKTKREIFINIFSLTFLDCLNHFRGSYFYDELQGMRRIN